jgi:uncharacterized membrane protein YeiB
MILVHFDLVVAGDVKEPSWLVSLVESLQGRAAATFVVLAGVGGSLGSARARMSRDPALQSAARRSLLRRGLFLFVVGCLFLLMWPADILHSYGLWLSLGAALLFARTSVLIAVALASVAGGIAFALTNRFFTHWNLTDLTYNGLWTPVGFLRNLIFDGWNPLFPWFALYVFGLILGRLDLRSPALRTRLALASLVVGAVVIAISKTWAPALLLSFEPAHLMMIDATPPTPFFIELGASIATLVIVVSIEVADRAPKLVAPLVSTGQLALTLYIAHVMVGLGALEEMGRLEGQSLSFAITSGLIFFGIAVLASHLWRKRFSRGPLEALMRAFG